MASLFARLPGPIEAGRRPSSRATTARRLCTRGPGPTLRAAIILVVMGRLIAIGTYATRDEAEIVEGLLASAGISASIRADDAGGAYPFDLSGCARLFVRDADAEAATAALSDRSDAWRKEQP